MILAGPRFRTLDPQRPIAEAVAVGQGGRIIAVGSYRELRQQLPLAEVADLGGGCALPGLIDAHGHLQMLGESRRGLDLSAARSAAEVAARVDRASRARGWVRGRGWNDALWPRPADASFLHGPSRGDPVALERSDSHALWVNQTVLDRLGWSHHTADPPGGRLGRIGNRLSGVLVDRAMEPVEQLMPAETPAEIEEDLLHAAGHCADLGLTGVHDAGLDSRLVAALLRLEADRRLPLRIYGMERDADSDALHVLEAGPRLPLDLEGRFSLRTVKLFADGALGSRGAAFFEPYHDAPDERGILLQELEPFAERMAGWMRRGFQVAVHAIGDRANHLALEGIALAAKRSGGGALRPRIEHAQHVRVSEMARFRQLGVIASMQPMHQRSDWPWARARLGPERLQGAYAWRSLSESGAQLAFGSDFPIESPNPLLGMAAAIGRSSGPDEPQEQISLEVALAGYTRGAAFAAFQEHELGQLREGFLADITVLDADPFEVTGVRLESVRARATVVGGRIRWCGGSAMLGEAAKEHP